MSIHGTRDSTKFCRHYDGSKLLQPRSAGLCRLGVDVPALVGGPRAGWLLRAPASTRTSVLRLAISSADSRLRKAYNDRQIWKRLWSELSA